MTLRKWTSEGEVDMTPEEEAEFLATRPAPNDYSQMFVKKRVYKKTLWLRCNDEEYEAIQTVLSAQSPRMRAVFNDALFISTDDDLYPLVLQGATAALGAERAAEILEPEE